MRPTTFAQLAGLTLLVACGGAPAEEADTEAPAAVEEAAAPARSGLAEVGTLTGTLGGEDRTWAALYMVRDGTDAATSTYQTRTIARRETYSLSVAGHVGATMSTDGSLRVSVLTTDAFDSCPCTFTDASVEYSRDFPDDMWEARQATVTIDLFYQNGDGSYGAEGSFSGTLARPDGGSDEKIPVEGTFDVRRILRVGEGA